MAHELDETAVVAGQIAPADVAGPKAQGVTMIVNNRPDGEDVGQPTSAEIEAAARDAGLDYRHVPIARGMGPSDVEAMRSAIHARATENCKLCRPAIAGVGVGGGQERRWHAPRRVER